ncbi:MAG: hypothetical protein RLZZ318_481 [Bacteroidota bacterium]
MPINVVKIREFIAHTQAVYTLCLSGKPFGFYSAGADGQLLEWEGRSNEVVRLAQCSSAVYALAKFNQYLLAGCSKGQLYLYDGALVKCIQMAASPIFDILAFKDQLFIVQGNGTCTVFNSALEPIKTIVVSDKPLRKIMQHHDQIHFCGSKGVVYQFDEYLNPIGTLSINDTTLFAMAYDPIHQAAFVAGKSGQLMRFNHEGVIEMVQAHNATIHDIAFSEDAQLLASASMDKSIRLWQPNPLKLLKVVNYDKQKAHQNSVNKILWFEKNNFISCSDDHTIQWFQIQES